MSELAQKVGSEGVKAGAEFIAPGSGDVAAGMGEQCCGACCGDASEEAEQKAAINAAHPLTGDPEIDKEIQEIRDQEFREWQKAKDIKKFDDLPQAMKNQLPVLKKMADDLAASLPTGDMELTLAEAIKKHPDKVVSIYKKLQDSGMAPKNMPLELALAMAKNTEVGQVKLSELKARVDNVAQSKGISGTGSIVAVTGGLAVGALVLGGLMWMINRRK